MKRTGIAIAALAAMTVTPALAADVALKAPPRAAAGWSWAGWYAGVNAGYGIGDPAITESSSAPVAGLSFLSNSTNSSDNGIIGGAQIGYNWQAAPNWLIGLEADFQESAQKHTDSFSTNFPALTVDTVGVDINWFGTARARVGFVADNANLWYVTGGYAYGRTELAFSSNNFIGFVANGTTHQTNSGWTIGGGVESYLYGNWTAKLEYLYLDLGSISGSAVAPLPGTPPGAFISASARIRDNIARAGLNYKF